MMTMKKIKASAETVLVMSKDKRKSTSSNLCLCGCGSEIKGRWKHGHNQRGSGCNFWKGGNKLTKNGYKRVPSGQGLDQVYEHREIMKKYLGRELTEDEEVHHINGDKSDNRIANLIIYSKSQHRILENAIPDIHLRVCYLCEGGTDVRKDGSMKWYKYEDGHICHRCYRGIAR